MISGNISNKAISKNCFVDLKSNYILKIVFCLMKEGKKLKIIKFNKKLQKKLSLTINDYKEYSKNISPIEIELTPVENKYGKFISISDKEKEFFHIYFNNSKKEIKRSSLEKNEKVKKIKIKIDHQIESFSFLFAHSECINSIKFIKFIRNNITDMSNMFSQCKTIKKIDFTSFNSINVINMKSMFSGCSSLKILDLTSFNTQNVTDMSWMFDGCHSLKQLNLTSFNTDNVTNMSNMFGQCRGLTKLNLSNFKTDKVTSMKYMFSLCFGLSELNISNFIIKEGTDVEGMFLGCPDKLNQKIKI